MTVRVLKSHPHFCNCELTCPVCVRRFWTWAEQHTRGRVPKGADAGPSFYEAAAAHLKELPCIPVASATRPIRAAAHAPKENRP